MKYPQLVSNRAISEISDWLIKRLEDLDVEQPGAYSRLLLSHLHTPFKVNAIDLLEIPQLKDLKQPYLLLNKNDDYLKRLAAVECLMELSAGLNKSNIISLVDELHSKLRKIENSGDESTLIGRSSNGVASTSPVTSSNSSKFYKNLKKIKRNHGVENPTKNYYLAFPALNSKKANTTITSGGCKVSSPGFVGETNKDSNLQLLCWSSLMTNAKESSLPTSSTVHDNEKLRNAVKLRPRRTRRYGRHSRRYSRNDVQCNAQSFDVYDDDATFSPKAKNGSKKHQRNQYVTSKNSAAKSCSGARSNSNFSNAQDAAPKMDYPAGSAPWDMDFKGHWEMDRDLIGEFIQQQQHQKSTKARSNVAKSTNQVEQAMDDADDVMLMKFLPMKLMDDEVDASRAFQQKEAQSISSLKSKFDANVKALWNDVDDPLTKPLTYKSFDDDGNASLVSSFASEKNSLGLFNFNGHQPHQMEVIAPSTNLQLYRQNNSSTDFMNISDFDCNNNNGGRGAVYKNNHLTSSSTIISPGVEKFIKSGTNLQTSIWSDGEFACEPESLIYKDVVDHGDDAIYKRMKSIGAEMKNWQKSQCEREQQDDDGEISLFNHSDVGAFKRFRPLNIPSTIIRANYHPMNTPQIERKKEFPVNSDDSENLLTAERTHFSPLMLDGHTFVVDDSYDEVKWERSASGVGYIYNDKRYMKWKHPNDRNDDNNNNNNSGIDLDSIEDDAKTFSVKFLVKDENSKGCQTEASEFLRSEHRSLVEINEEYCKRKIYDEYFKGIGDSNNKWRYHLNADDSNDYSFFSVNRVKSNVPPKSIQDILISSNSSSSSICTITSSSYETSAVDPFESWRSIKVDNGGMLDSDYKQACMHSLWEQCNSCTRNDYDPYYEEKSIPANRLLKDELRMDGDEIMSVIQNLYITGDYCDDDEEKDEDDGEDMNHFYMDMLDDSMDGIAEEESKFYEADNKKDDEKGKKTNFTPNMFDAHQREELLHLENFDEITMAKLQWRWDKNRETEKDQEKYLKLLKWIQASLLKEEQHPDSNNNCQMSSQDFRPKNRKRRHSTCQNFMENKTSRSQDLEFTYHLNLDQSPNPLIEENANIFVDAAKQLLKVNIEKILLIADPNGSELEQQCKDENGANYYRNILQQQHALIKQMDLARPLTR